jgi:ABC-type multidrug transport system fused ATPase/permease subunit
MKIRKKLKKIAVNKKDNLDPSRIISTIKKLRKDFKKYLKAVLMLIYDAYQLDKKRFIAVIVTSGAGISMLGFSLGVLLKYVKHLESNSPLKYLWYHFYPRDGFVLAFISVTFMVLLVLSAGLLLYSRLKTRDILVDFNLTTLARVAEKFGWDPPDDIAWLNDSLLKSNIRTLYTSDSQRSAMALRRLSEGYQHFLTAFGGLAVLLWLDAAATFYLILIILLSLIFFYKINKRASRATRDYENLSGDSNRRARALLDNIGSWPNPEFNPAALRSITHESYLKDNNILLFDRFATRSMTEFLSYVLMAAALGLLVLTLGYAAMEGKNSWASVVGYIVVLQMVLKAFKTLSKIITEVTRIYPSISRLYEFNKKTNTSPSKEKINELNLILSDDALSDKNEKTIRLLPGDIIGLSAPVSLSRYSIKFFEKILTGSKRKRKKSIAGLIHSISISVPLKPPLVPITIRELLGIPAETGAPELRSAAGSLVRNIEKVFLLDPETVISKNELGKLSKDSLNRFSLISCSISHKSILLVHSSLISEDWLRENKTMLKNHILVICFNGLPDKQISQQAIIKTYIAAAADGTIVASGSFSMMKKRNAAVKKIIEDHAQDMIQKSEKMVVLTDIEDEDDDD